jgi:hypothetical protein
MEEGGLSSFREYEEESNYISLAVDMNFGPHLQIFLLHSFLENRREKYTVS